MNKELWKQLDGVEYIPPGDGWTVEQLRRAIIDCLDANGYELVIPPLADYAESLLSSSHEDLDLLTVKVPDPVNGRLYGIRADMTPQVAKIAALHTPVADGIIRLSYLGPVLLARAPDLGARRELFQFGAELFGSPAPESDCEVIRLMVQVLQIAGVESLSVSLGHVGIVNETMAAIGIDDEIESELLNALQRKSNPDLKDFALQHGSSKDALEVLHNLVQLNGASNIAAQAEKLLSGMSPRLDNALEEFTTVVELVRTCLPELHIHLDYAQIGGYKYHTGTIFSAYGPGYGQALAKGGRYDGILSAYGISASATGFSGDLRLLLEGRQVASRKAILVPVGSDVPIDVVELHRMRGDRVIHQLPGQSKKDIQHTCDRVLVQRDAKWVVEPLES